ncbi:MAG: precorrin-2 C(20)-methyltransferase [Candidatus Bathyarchaeia archaeon]
MGIGVGPGDPALITIKALEALRAADVICAPKASQERTSMALETVKPLISNFEKSPEILELVFPMLKDRQILQKVWRENAEAIIARLQMGKKVAFVTIGDPMLYSTFIYVYQNVVKSCPHVDVEVIPGVASIMACAAVSRMPIAKADETVAILSTGIDLSRVGEVARHIDTIFFVKGARNIKEIASVLLKNGFNEDSPVVIFKKQGYYAERVKTGTLKELQNWEIEDYFSIVMVRRKAWNVE